LIILYYRKGWRSSYRSDVFIGGPPTTKFSIIIAARNEEDNIAACLDSIQKLQYPKELYEVIVVDDHSEDNTASVVRRYLDIRLLQLKDEPHKVSHAYKKQAIALGISKSSGDYIVTTDADCIVPLDWLRCFDSMVRKKHCAFIAAPVAIHNESSCLQIFESIDFMMLQGITAASVHTGIHAMSNGANLCYRRAAYEEAGGFTDTDHIASGDDMLLMQKIKNRHPHEIGYCHMKEAIVLTRGATNMHSFLMQRIRWASKGKYYDEYILKLILMIVFLFNLSILILMGMHIIMPELFLMTGLLLIYKICVELLFLYPVSKFFHKERFLLYFIPFQPLHIIYMVFAALLGNFTKYTWKGRSVQ
jgi:cellulose synthase/poly-beta-1,6-N-acetylglucosamine synthase-like glycosyltransferase